jgi:hypothetical protein
MPFLVLVFLAMAAIEVWAAAVVTFGRNFSARLCASFWIIAFVAVVAAVGTTSGVRYYADPNTIIHGWPVPQIIFQRDSPTAPWLDFVGPLLILAYPMNFILYMAIPSLAFVLVYLWKRRYHQIRGDQTRRAT